MATNKTTNILYWTFTILFGGFMLFSAIPDVANTKQAMDIMQEMLHYPAYFNVFIGVAKILGVIGIFIPGFPRIREWAYAGLIFDLVGATYSMAMVSKSGGDWLPMLLFIALGFASYFFYHKKYKPSVL